MRPRRPRPGAEAPELNEAIAYLRDLAVMFGAWIWKCGHAKKRSGLERPTRHTLFEALNRFGKYWSQCRSQVDIVFQRLGQAQELLTP